MNDWYEQSTPDLKVTRAVWDENYSIDEQMECDLCGTAMGEIVGSEKYIDFWSVIACFKEMEVCQKCYDEGSKEIDENGEWK
jgi:hypothetical protein